jgi:hypothetical protein
VPRVSRDALDDCRNRRGAYRIIAAEESPMQPRSCPRSLSLAPLTVVASALMLLVLCTGPRVAWTQTAEPQPAIPNFLSPDAEERNRELRERWLESLHRTGPGFDWRLLERANQQQNFLTRQAMSASSSTSWSEVGASNLAGRTHVAVTPDGSRLYVGSNNGGLWLGSTSGGPWTPISDGVGKGVHSLVVVPGTPEVIVTTTNNGDVHASTNGGTSWFVPAGIPSGVWSCIRLLRDRGRPRTVYLLAQVGEWRGYWYNDYRLLRSDDGGVSFAAVHIEPSGTRPDIWMDRVQGGPLYLAAGGGLMRSTDNGASFAYYKSFPFISDRVVLTASEATSLTSSDPAFYVAIRQSPSSNWSVYGLDNSGKNILNSAFTYRSAIYDFWETLCASIVDRNLVFTGGTHCNRSTDGGVTFTAINYWGDYYANPSGRLHADIPGIDVLPVFGNAPLIPVPSDLISGPASPSTTVVDEIYYIHTDGGTYVSRDRGRTVQNVTLSGFGNAQYYSILTSRNDPHLIAAGAQDQGFQVSTSTASLPLQFTQRISGDYGHLTSRAHDHNMLWAVYPSFFLVQPAEGNPSLELYNFPAAGNRSWMPFILADPDNSAQVYLCADRLWRITRNAANSYSSVQLPQDFSSGSGEVLTAFAISPADHSYWYAVTNAGKLWFSHNSGSTWTKSGSTGPQAHYFYGTDLLASPTNRNLCYVGGSGYNGASVYKTANGGTSWTAMGTGMPQTLVYGLDFDNPTSQNLYAAAEAGPFRYNAATGSWVNLLTTACCAPLTTYWDVESVPGAGIVRFATYGRGIWDYSTIGSSSVTANELVAVRQAPTLSLRSDPTAHRTKVGFDLERSAHAKVEVFDIAGRRLGVLADGLYPAGRNAVELNWRGTNGHRLESGIYLVRILTPEGTDVRKLTIVK